MYGSRTEGYLLSSGHRLRVELGTDASACPVSTSTLRALFPSAGTRGACESEKPPDTQETGTPLLGVVELSTEGVQTLTGAKLVVPFSQVVPLLVRDFGGTALASARLVSAKHLDTLRPVDRLYQDSVSEYSIWSVSRADYSNLSDEEWLLCEKYHSSTKGRVGSEELR